MTRWTLRRRLNSVVLQWFLLFGGVAGAALLISIPGIRRMLVDDRVLLARTIAQSLDATMSTAVQDLGRLAADLPEHPADNAAARLHIFRLSSPFAESAYVLDHQGQVVAADPPGARPLPEAWLGYHEAVTPLVLGVGPESHPVLAMVEPFTRGSEEYYLVSEMNPIGSTISAFLRDLEPELDMHVVIVDEHGAVVASNDPAQLFRRLANAEAYRGRIGAHRPLVIEDARCEFESDGGPPPAALMVMVPLRFAPWGVVIEQHKTAALAGVYTLWRWLGLSGVLLAAMAVLLARALSRSVVSPIRALSREAEAMRSGDLTTPISAAGDLEIEVLAKTLDEARGRLASTLGELTTLNDHLEDQVAARTAKLAAQDEQRKVLVRRLLGATEDERRRLARELHDEISQLLTVIQLSLDRVDVDPSEMTRARELLTRTQREIHGIIHDLRPSLLDDLGLSAAIRSHVQDHLRSQGLEVSVEIDEALPQRPATDTVVFRIFQELMTNILRHAQAEHVSIELYERDGKRVLEVEDDGVGFDPDAKAEGAGVLGMRERAALVDGVIRFDSEPGMGTHVVLEIPTQ
jgi:two-component system sensor histidine kinase UhpB